jgi:two-component system cell cycle response regulator
MRSPSTAETQQLPAMKASMHADGSAHALPADGSAHALPALEVPTPLAWTVPPELRVSRAFLTMLAGPQPGRAFAFTAYVATIGRDAACTIVVDDAAISRRHASVLRLPNGLFVAKDLGSTNGTFVNSRRIAAGTRIEPGDRIQLGPNVTFRFGIGDDVELELQQRLYESSTYDALTGALNRASFFRRFEVELELARRHSAGLSLLMLDVDHFKRVNDEHGHAAGDAVLRDLGRVLGNAVRTSDVVGRYGGEELVVLARAMGHADAIALAERVREAVVAALPVTVSVGVASASEVPVTDDGTALCALADERVYVAKRAGRNRVIG